MQSSIIVYKLSQKKSLIAINTEAKFLEYSIAGIRKCKNVGEEKEREKK